MQKVSFKDLTPEEQAEYGNGCSWVPDFVFTASCRQHDFNWERGCGATHWYENLWKAPYYYTRSNWHFFIRMWSDCFKTWHYFFAVVYFVGVMLFGWPSFTIGRWRTKEEILLKDKYDKLAKQDRK